MKQWMIVSVVAMLAAGCGSSAPKAPKPAKPTKPVAQVIRPTAAISGQFVTGNLVAACEKLKECKTFELTLASTSDAAVEIDWNRSYYVNNGKADGKLYFDGVAIEQRDNPRAADIILPMSTFKKTLVPSNNFDRTVLSLSKWNVKGFEGNSHGVYMTLKSKGKEETLSVAVDLGTLKK